MNVSQQTQAIILLGVSLGKTDGNTDAKPLSIKEWARFAVWLKDHELEPSRLLNGDPKSLLSGWMDRTVTPMRIESLLDRGGALGLALEKWQRAGLWIITRSDADYPKRLKLKLGLDSPPVLFGSGNKALLGKGGIAVVGSRNADKDALGFCSSLACEAARQGLSVVSGAARGVDECAMLATLDNEGTSIGVMADSLLRSASSAKYRKHLRSGDLALVSPFNPEAGFNVGNAMARNKYIYCLSDAAVVVNSAPGKGGTWNGAVENLKHKWVPLWVKSRSNSESGNAGLVQSGAQWLPEETPELSTLWKSQAPGGPVSESSNLPSPRTQAEAASNGNGACRGVSPAGSKKMPADAIPEDRRANESGVGDKPAELSLDFYNLFLKRMHEITSEGPMKLDEISKKMKLERPQLNAWLKRAVADGEIKKLSKPVRYQSHPAQPRQASFL